MKNSYKVLFYAILFAAVVGMAFYGGRNESELLRLCGVERAHAQGLSQDDPSFPILFQAYRIVKESYLEDLEKPDDMKKMEYGAIRGMLKSLGDQYTRFMDPTAYKNMMIDTKGEFGGIGITIGINKYNAQLTVISPLEDTPAYRIGLKAGDIILKINGTSTEDMALDDAVSRIRGPKGEKVTLTIWRPGFDDNGKDFEIIRDIIELKPVKKFKMLENNIGYAKLESFSEASAPDLSENIKSLKAQGMKAFILDLRNNPGGLLPAAIDVSRLFINEGPIVHRQSREGKTITYYAKPGTKILSLPMVVLVNGYSASASEIVSGALQDHGVATIIGQTTFGKGLVQSIFRLDDESAILVTTDKYLTAKKRDINKHGIVPDIVVSPSAVDAHEGKSPTNPEESEDEDTPSKTTVGKFPIAQVKGHNGVIFNGMPVKNVFYKKFDNKHYLEVDDVAALFKASVKLDEANKILNIDQKEKLEEDTDDIQLKRAVEFLENKLGVKPATQKAAATEKPAAQKPAPKKNQKK